MNRIVDESIIDASISLNVDSAHALKVLEKTLAGLEWKIVESSRDGLTGQHVRHGYHTIVVTCLPCTDARTDLLITISTINGRSFVQNTIDAINALRDAAVMKIA
ncbi:MAG TPA: hypothetical protein V6C89_06770 [Drouetiella sp.]|jgi:hypothetical protein